MAYEYKYIVVLLSNNHSTLLYKNLKTRGYKVELISAPSSISRGCKRAVKFYPRDIDIVKEEIDKNKFKIKGIYKRRKENGKIIFVAVK